jgi:adenosylcobinamide-phosphate synthase
VIVLAAIADGLLGEPPARLHPVALMGRYLSWAGRRRTGRPTTDLLGGTAAWLVGAAASGAAAAALERVARRSPAALGALLRAAGLWPLFSLRLLLEEVARVEGAQSRGPAAARCAVSRVVGRPVAGLPPAAVRSAALESLSENLSDSLVAPLLWSALLGLPGAAVYRFANTADAMWGHHGDLEWWGKPAARLDDLANLVPARATSLLLAAGPVPLGALRREAARTSSPNAGWPMAALALRLGVRLEKVGHHRLNGSGRPPAAADTGRALRLVAARAGLAVALLGGLEAAVRRG